MKILELFSGYGTATFALKRLGIPHEIVGYSDIDKYANQCFKQNHAQDDINDKKKLGDVKLINPNDLEDFDLLTGGFPCQSFSVAGKRLGELDPRGTLFYEIIRIAEVKQPKYMLLENVKGLTNKTHKATFDKILSELDRIGYKVYWKVLNSKDYGIPQSRARVWFVCFRKDIDKGFKFPEPVELKIFIKDILEENVDPKYYLSEKLQERFAKYLEDKNRICNLQPRSPTRPSLLKNPSAGGSGLLTKNDGTCYCIDQNNTQGIVAMRSYPRSGTKEEDGERFQNLEEREDGCSNSLTSVQKDNLVFDKAQGKETTEVYEVNPENDLERPSYLQYQNGHHSELHRVYNSEGISQTMKPHGLKIYDRKGFDSRTKGFRENELSPTLTVKMGTGGNNVPMVLNQNTYYQPSDAKGIVQTIRTNANCNNACPLVMNTITTAVGRSGHSSEELGYIENNMKCGQLRRLTPKECFRLVGFLNDEINLEGLSDTQRYKLAGNGQDVNMVSLIFKEMFK